jgi:hypothetical protein
MQGPCIIEGDEINNPDGLSPITSQVRLGRLQNNASLPG